LFIFEVESKIFRHFCLYAGKQQHRLLRISPRPKNKVTKAAFFCFFAVKAFAGNPYCYPVMTRGSESERNKETERVIAREKE
jgi:hypothetical protein